MTHTIGMTLCFMLLGCSVSGRKGQNDDHTGDAGAVASVDGSSPSPADAAGSGCAHSVVTDYRAGADGIVGTSDDLVDTTTEYDYAAGTPDFARKHPLNIWQKDQVGKTIFFEKATYDAQGVLRTETFVKDPGSDGKYGTADDVIGGANQFFYDAAGLLVRETSSHDAGPDGVWGNQDDLVEDGLYVTNANGRIEYYLHAYYPGPDGLWGTADDPFISSLRLLYDDQGRVTAREASHDAGPDLKFGTSDDPIELRIAVPCRGDRVVWEGYVAPGPDGKWGTPDDQLDERGIESGDACQSAGCDLLIL